MFKQIIKNIVFVLLPTIIVCLILTELFFRFGIPAAESPYFYYDKDDNMMRFDTSVQREGTFTIGRFAEYRAKWRVNDAGWNSEVDYLPAEQREKPLIAIFGDSYIEALQVDVDENIAGVLRDIVGDEYDVYSFGTSGSALPQYLNMARYANRHFQPDIIVVTVIHNDFTESLKEFNNRNYHLRLDKVGDNIIEIAPKPYVPSKIKRLMRPSSIVRYLYQNLKVKFDFGKKENPKFVSNININVAESNRSSIDEAVHYVVKKFRGENPDKAIIFMIDAPKSDIYNGTVETSEIMWMHDMLKEACQQDSCYYLDLTYPFLEKFTQDSIRFNPPIDGHWYEEGHKTAANVLYKHLLDNKIIDSPTKTETE
ncbi:hypothetical protein K9N50_01690 [bacterium]|nr:hypothetical protein [bacterium]